MLESAGTRIATLRMTGDVRDAVGLRLAVERQLAGVELSTPGLPPSALVMIRKLEDPRPGSFDGASEGFRPPPEWEVALRETVAELGRRAAWPERGDAARDAPAVAFSDRASMAACLVTDLTRGSVAECWWWQRVHLLLPELVRRPERASEVARLLVALAPQIPAIFARLVELGSAVEVVSELSREQVHEVARALVHAFDLSRELETAPLARPAISSQVGARFASPPEAAPQGLRGLSAREQAPWSGWVPREPQLSTPGDVQHWLLGLALGLYRAPAIVRSRTFMQSSVEWWGARSERIALAEPPPMSAVSTRLAPPARSGEPLASGSAADPSPASRQGPAARKRPAVTDPRGIATGNAATDPLQEEGLVDGTGPTKWPVEREDSELARRQDERETRLPEAPQPSASETPEDSPSSIRDSLSGEVFETVLGGVFYLITALRALEIPDAFERGWRIPSRLGSWGAVDLIARALLGDRLDRVAHDPVWSALRGLRGEVEASRARADRHSGPKAWHAAPAYRAPASWSSALEVGERRFLWAADRSRLWLWSSAGYVAAVVPRRGRRPSRQAAEVLAAFLGETGAPLARARLEAAPLERTGRLESESESELRRWAAAVAPAVRRRITLALSKSCKATNPVYRLLTLRAQLFLTSSHVDLVADLDQVWMPARMAGLDRDPGWLPEYGRVVLFHFE